MEPELNQADRFYTVVSPTFAAAIAEKSLPEFAARRILSYRVSMIERLFAKDHGWRWEEANMGTVVCVAILLGPWLARVSGREPIIALVLRLALHSCRLSRTLVGMGQWWGRQL
ncbi:unnamed protein product [Durusdinium trenchii]|uniref:Uncharacterized protein n=1 Tax=Durusdinium trenchii TaxID=1381693 RepID=A0ABP0HD61_9DINO